jgi:adenylate kinase
MIVVTGTPGSGKTTVARRLAKTLRMPFIAVNDLVKEKRLYTGVSDGSLVVNAAKLARALRGFRGVVEGHVLSDMRLPASVCVVLRASPRSIAARLRPRRYSPLKLEDNIEAEALDYCAIHALQNYRCVVQVDTTGRTPAESAKRALRAIRTMRSDRVDWSAYFL